MHKHTRFVKVNSERSYVIPAIKLKEWTNSEYYEAVTHIGTIDEDGKPACFCGRHHYKHHEWVRPMPEEQAYITCGGCLKVLKRVIRDSIDPYMDIMHKLGHKLADADSHMVHHGTKGSNTPNPVHAEPPTDAPYGRLLSNGIVLHACEAMCYMDSPRKGLIHSVASDGNHGTTTVCGDIALGTIPKEHYPIYPDITCPECAKITRERHPDTPILSPATKSAIYALNLDNFRKEEERVDQMYRDWQEAKANLKDLARNTTIIITK